MSIPAPHASSPTALARRRGARALALAEPAAAVAPATRVRTARRTSATRPAPSTPPTTPPRRRTPRAQAAPAAPATPRPTRRAAALEALVAEVLAQASAPQADTPPEAATRLGITPANTVFVSLCFEGPDAYAQAGGLGTRVTEMCTALAQQGFETHLIFVGDPRLPGAEQRVGGKLHLHRWCQWLSHGAPNGVYDGEERKLADYAASVPRHVCEAIAEPAIRAGKLVVLIGEDWHTAETISRTSDALHQRGLRERCLLLWNCNSLMSLHRIDWQRLAFTASITTVSRYMKQRLWQYGVNPIVIPNGIPARFLDPVDAAAVAALRTTLQRGEPERLVLFKIARFDPDKRWHMAIEAAAQLKAAGVSFTFLARGGLEPHGGEVLARARALGLTVRDVEATDPSPDELRHLLGSAGAADIYTLRFYMPPRLTRICYAAADAVLANSGHEPFGLVGLEVMATGGVAFTGSTGEDYVISFENAVALETEDPDEIVGYLLHLAQHPADRAKIRAAGPVAAAQFTWEQVTENLCGKLHYLARKQRIVL